MTSPALTQIEELAAQLPFHLDETARVNEAFERLREGGRPDDARIVDLWTYCFIRRYFLLKFLREPAYNPSDLDQVEARTFKKITAKRATIRDNSRYANWVSVVCKNQFINYLRARKHMVQLDPTGSGTLLVEEQRQETHCDLSIVLQALLRAILRLPPFLRDVARMRFVQDRSFDEIALAIDKPVPTVRAYVSKAVHRFRDDEELSSLLRERALE